MVRAISNPYIFGQFTLLFGAVALGLAMWPGDPQSRLYVAAWVVAGIGIILSLIGWYREKPPILPILGVIMCLVAISWYLILAVFGTAALLGYFYSDFFGRRK